MPDARCYLHHGLLELGEPDEARRLADEMRRSAPDDPDVYMCMAEDYKLPDLQEAHRWVSRDANRLDPSGAIWSTFTASVPLVARRRVRRDLGYPPEDLDRLVPPPLTDADEPSEE